MSNTYKAEGKVYMFKAYGEDVRPYDYDACAECHIELGTDSCSQVDCTGGFFVEDNFKEQIKEKRMNKNVPHKHAEIIKLWADGSIIELLYNSTKWVVTSPPTWSENCQYRVQPEKVFPKTSMTLCELGEIYRCFDDSIESSCKDVADAAIEHFIKNDMEAYLLCNK